MTASVVEAQAGTYGTTGSTTLTFATTPQAGDVVVVAFLGASGAGSRYISTTSGLGATWTTPAGATWLGSNATAPYMSVMIGTGATTSGNVTVTLNTLSAGQVRGWIVRGAGSYPRVIGTVLGSGTSLAGPTLNHDTFVMALAEFGIGSTDTSTIPSATTPSTGWTWGTKAFQANATAANVGYYVPSGATDTSISISSTAAASARITLLGLSAPPSTPTVLERVVTTSSAKVTTYAATFTTVPEAGDVIVATFNGYSASATDTTLSSISGSPVTGATWTTVQNGTGSAQLPQIIAIGTTPNAAGKVQFNLSLPNEGELTVYLVRGLTATTTVVGEATTETATSLTSPTKTAGAGTFALLMGVTLTTGTAFSTTTPSTGWTTDPVFDSTGAIRYANAYLIPTSTTSVSGTVTRTASGPLRATTFVIGPAPAATSTTTGTVPVAVPVSAVSRASLLRSSGTVPLAVPASATARAIPRTSGTLDLTTTASGTAAVILHAAGTVPLTVTLPSAVRVTTSNEGMVPLGVAVAAGTSYAVIRGSGTLSVSLVVSATSYAVTRTSGVLPLAVPVAGDAHIDVGVITTHGELPLTLAVSGGLTTDVRMSGWTADRSQAPLLIVESPELSVLVVTPPGAADPTPDPQPGGVTVPAPPVGRYLTRNSVTLTATPPAGGAVRLTAADFTVATSTFARVRIIVGGKDVTHFRGAPTRVDSYALALPFGDQTAQVSFPQVTPFDVPGSGDLSWLKEGASLDIILEEVGSGFRWRRFEGYLISQDTGNDDTSWTSSWQAVGALMQAGQARHRVPTILDPTDIGRLVPKALNDVVSRRYPAIPAKATGIKTTQKGSADDSALAYAQNLLATAWTDNADQWTVRRGVGPRIYFVGTKSYIHPPDQAHADTWTVYAGAPGVQVELSRDLTETVNVIYGRGVGPTGYAWAGWQYPGLHGDTAPGYPFSSPSSLITVGTTDAATSSGTGVSDWQQRAKDLGYKITVDGAFSSTDADVARQVQADRGLLVDGIVGPQTWDATFAVGSNSGSLTGAYRKPLVIDPRVEPHLYAADGAIVGANPAYDPTRLRFERDVDYGSGVAKADALRSAKVDLARDKDPAWTGTVTLATDPVEYSRWTIEEGQPLRIKGFQQADIDVRVVQASFDLTAGTVTLAVDTKARDAMTLEAIRERNQASKKDPARRPGNVQRRSRLANDVAIEFDGESKAGIIPRHALYGGLWTVLRIPVSELGRIAKIDMTSTGSQFCVALFGAPVEPADLVHLVGNPLASDNPFNVNATQAAKLDDLGFIEGWGQKGQACGYWPKAQSDTGAALTGRFVDTGGVEYVSAKPPWVWVAEYAASSTFMTGRIWPAPIQ